MKPIRAAMRRQLDSRLEGLDETIGCQPLHGWIRTIRDALGMGAYDLAARMELSPSRARRIERAEVDGFIKLETLARAAAAMNCQLYYVFVPDEPLVSIVRNQARQLAVAELGAPEHGTADDEVLEARTYELIDSWNLWRRPPEPPSVSP